MSSSKIFGLALFVAGVFIASLYTLWVSLQMPILQSTKESLFGNYFPPAILLLQLPGLALAGGLALIYFFVVKTQAALDKKKAAEAKKA